MTNQYYMPTKVVTGAGCVQAQGALMKPLGTRALIVTGAHSAKASGALDDLIAALTANGQRYTLFDQAVPNPTLDSVYAGVAAAKAAGAEFVAAIGGGSPMDTAKAIALAAAQDIPREKLFDGGYGPEVLPLVCIPTTSGTGSEVTQYSVLTYDEGQTKRSIGSPLLFPRLAYLDGSYTLALPHRVTVNTAIDALSHCVEGMLSNLAGEISDALAREGCRRIAACYDALAAGTLTPAQRDSLMMASALGGMTIAATGTTAVHAMGYPLTYFHGIEHGRANGLLLADFLGFCAKAIPERAADILTACGCADLEGFRAVLDGLLGEKERLSEEEITAYAAKASQTGNIPKCLVRPAAEDIADLYRASLG